MRASSEIYFFSIDSIAIRSAAISQESLYFWSVRLYREEISRVGFFSARSSKLVYSFSVSCMRVFLFSKIFSTKSLPCCHWRILPIETIVEIFFSKIFLSASDILTRAERLSGKRDTIHMKISFLYIF